ncbi:MAG: hypothetical protein EXS30_04410 [Pedosphaera sp.]|nr:hypothetical protein [Pedosphaera sp.]
MSWGWRPYVPVAQRRANAARKIAKMTKGGRAASPINLQGRAISTTFWGKAWCDNLESYSDYSNRLPRGRTYVRNGSVVDLQITEGKVSALVSGSELYKIEIKIKPLNPASWTSVQTECAGKIDSLIELLQGRLSAGVMERVTRPENGLFPKPSEISMSCSCPDWAGMCKHIAASLYGVGARLDEKPDLLFLLRGVDPAELISKAFTAQAIEQTGSADDRATIGETELADVFGIELDAPSTVAQTRTPPAGKTSKPAKPLARAKPAKKPVKKLARKAKAPKKTGLRRTAGQS